ncbi:MAG TPA: methylated-DNA--[protein]-cysteine S-methyltransferase [candidate division Zixibacteria bacterium]|nr:methylated-DNA--[protein]-cysteine S-methyltransferase [candidate division Zixibacteria bacterium]
MKLWTRSFDSHFGRIQLASDDEALIAVALPGQTDHQFHEQLVKRSSATDFAVDGPVNLEAERQLRAYFEGRLQRFDLPLKLSGGAFCRRALAVVSRIEYGHTRTYGEIAAELGKPGGARAVGQANAGNPLPLVIPCHRVVGADGLGGYGGGLDMKRRLLQLEGVSPDVRRQGTLL